MKLIYILVILLLMSCSSGGLTAKNDKLVQALNNTDLKIRGELIEISSNNYRLDYYDIHEKDSHFKFLDEKGY